MDEINDPVEGEYDSDSLVPIGQLAETFDPNGFFDGDVDPAAARVAVGRLKTLEEMLKATEQFGRYATQFCVLEANMYVHIAKFDGAEEKLTAAQRRLVGWLRSRTEGELTEVMAEVAEGTRITTIERRANKGASDNSRQQGVVNECKRISEAIVDDLTRTGRTSLSQGEFLRRWKSSVPPDHATVKAFTESTRDMILHSKGRGLGDGAGTYMLVDKCERADVAQIVKTRLESIVNDLRTLAEICSETGFAVPQSGIDIINEIVASMGEDSRSIAEVQT